MATWEEIRNGILAGESGGDYNALFGFSNRNGGRFSNVKLTGMTLDQALQFANPSGEYGQHVKGQIGRVATPLGAYQVVGTTLKAAKDGLGLTGNEVMTPELQDLIGRWIYASQGTGAWEGYKGPQAAPPPGAAPTDPQAPQNAFATQQPPEAPQNALVRQFQPQFQPQDPAAFMRQRNALAFAPVQYEHQNILGRL